LKSDLKGSFPNIISKTVDYQENVNDKEKEIKKSPRFGKLQDLTLRKITNNE